MKIYRGKIRPIAEEIVKSLDQEGDIEVSEDQLEEVILDVEAIIKEYIRMEEEINRQARELLQQRGISYQEFGKVRRMIAEEKNFEIGDKAIKWIANQILECFMLNNRVDEIYSPDWEIKKKIAKVFGKHLGIEEEIDKEVRAKIKNIQEGTPEWEIEYRKVFNQLAKRKGLL